MRQLAALLYFISCSCFAAVHVCTDSEGHKIFTDGDCPGTSQMRTLPQAAPVPAQSPAASSSAQATGTRYQVTATVTSAKPAPVGAAANQNQTGWVGHPMNFDLFNEPKHKFERLVIKHANFANIWDSKLQLGALPLFFLFIGAASCVFLIAYLILVLKNRTSYKRQREAVQNIQPD